MPRLSSGRGTATLSPPLPIYHDSFRNLGLVFRQRQFSMVASAPNVGKTLFAQNFATHCKVPTLFLSADSSEFDVKTRAISITTGTPLDKVVEQIEEPQWEEYYIKGLEKVNHIDFSYYTDLSNEDHVMKMILAFEQKWGEVPKLTIIDNLGDTVTENGAEEFGELRGTCRALKEIARTTGSHVMALHHVNGADESGYTQITLKSLQGKLGKIPEIVIGLNWSDYNGQTVNMSVIKSRGGKRERNIPLVVDYSRAWIGGFN